MINSTFDKVKETSTQIAAKGKEFFDQRVSPVLPEQVKEALDKLEVQRERLEKEGREFLAKMLADQREYTDKVQKMVLNTVDDVLHKLNATTKERFDILAKGIERIEARLATLEETVAPAAEKAEPELAFPIENYDKLNVEDVKKALEGLEAKALELVKTYEAEHKNRKTVLEAIDAKLA